MNKQPNKPIRLGRRQIYLKIFEYLTRIVVEQIPLCDLCACSTAPAIQATAYKLDIGRSRWHGAFQSRTSGNREDFGTLHQLLLCCTVETPEKFEKNTSWWHMTLHYGLSPSVGSPEYQKAPYCSILHQIVKGWLADSGLHAP